MKDNIESKHIGNRKLILEIRYDHKVVLLDKKGTIIEAIKSLNIFAPLNWEIGAANLHIYDAENKNDARTNLKIELNSINLSCSRISSVEKFYSDFEKVYNILKKELGDFNVKRIGCRIIGTYYTETKEFVTILNKMKAGFPSQFYLDKFPATDLLFHLNYNNGTYDIGPVNNENDPFVERNFAESFRKNHAGIAIDTDNFLTNTNGAINDKQYIKDTYILSLSVEKSLFENLKGI